MMTSTSATVRIWDLPTRLFHWSLTLCVVLLIMTGKVGGDAMVWHFRLGYTVFALLAFRFVWGLVGGHWSRWLQLPLAPRHVLAYLQGRSDLSTNAGHNPIGSWSVLLMLLTLSLQVSTGLISDDEIANVGPLSSLAPDAWILWATHWHKSWGQWFIFCLVLVHVLAILWYSIYKHQSLVSAMLHGDKILPHKPRASVDSMRSRLLALLIASLASVLVICVIRLGG
jgi:cytochrome b